LCWRPTRNIDLFSYHVVTEVEENEQVERLIHVGVIEAGEYFISLLSFVLLSCLNIFVLETNSPALLSPLALLSVFQISQSY
jgi:hypothetical protein